MLRLGRHRYAATDLLVMAIVNRTPDSFYDAGRAWEWGAALERVAEVVEQGADLVDIGGVKAGPGHEVTVAEEIDRVAGFVAAVRSAHPDLVVSVDTWRAAVAREVCEAGADLLNDAWGGHDPALARTAATYDVGLVCTHTGGAVPRSVPRHVAYDDVVTDVVEATTRLADRAVAAGVAPDRILVDPAHDFGKNTLHSLEVTRRLGELVARGRPVLVSLSRKDFVGETLDLPTSERLPGTLAATALCAWQGAQVFRVHDVPETRQVLDMVAAVRGDRPPAGRLVHGVDEEDAS